MEKRVHELHKLTRIIKKRLRTGIQTLLPIIYSLLILFGCDNSIDQLKINNSVEDRYGRISINLIDEKELLQTQTVSSSISNTARTVLPSTAFDKYVYIFTKTGESIEKTPDDDGFFTLEVGNYTVTVLAYIGNAEHYDHVATGESPSQFTVGPGNNAPVEVRLTKYNSTGQGFFNYTITYPAGAEAEIILQKWEDMSDVTLAPNILTEGIGKTQTLQLDAGYYILTVIVTKDDLYAGVNEAIHIYPFITTTYTKDFDVTDLLADAPIFNVSLNITAPVRDEIPDTIATKNNEGNFTIGTVTWSPSPEDNRFFGGTEYTATVTLTADSRNTFLGINTANINGQIAEVTNNTGVNITLSCTFAATEKYEGGTVSTPVFNSKTHNSITINPATAPDGQTVEYGINTINSTPYIWQPSAIFEGLNAGTTYYIFARAAGNDNYKTGNASGSLQVTTLQTIASSRFEYYWIDKDILVTTSGGETTLAAGETLTIAPQGTGYIVKSWHLNGVNTGQSTDMYHFSSVTAGRHTVGLFVEINGKLYNTNIVITVNRVTVTYNLNGGTGTTPAAQTIDAGSNATLPSQGNIYRSGYTFGGWCIDPAGVGVNYNAGSSFTPTSNVTLYARWDSTVTYYIGTNSTGTVPPAQTVPAGSSITLPEQGDIVRTGYTFAGWNTNSSGTGINYGAGSTFIPNGDINLYARWLPTVTFHINGGSPEEATPPPQTVPVGSSSITLPSGDEFYKTGYTFAGWNTNSSGTGTNYSAGSAYSPTSNITLYARWIYGEPQIIIENTWTDGYIDSSGGEQWFKFIATSSTCFLHYDYNVSTLSGLYIQVYDSNSNKVGTDKYFNINIKYNSQTLVEGQMYFLRVYPSYTYQSGEYRIAINSTPFAPNVTVTTLTANTWSPNFYDYYYITSPDEQWFRFTATANIQHIHVSLVTTTLTFPLRVINSNNNIVEGLINSWSDNYRKEISVDTTIGQDYYIRVGGPQNTGTGGYRITFNESETPPPLQ